MQTKTTTKPNVINDMQVGDIFSETSHYVVVSKDKGNTKLLHTESGETVTLSNNYVQNLLTSADQYFDEKTVGKEDKKDGTQGIRSLWESIHSAQVFAVCYRKQDTVLSQTKINQARESQLTNAIQAIENAQKNKKGVATVAKQVIAEIQSNPVQTIEPGEMRTLRGYKIQFESRDGRYNCIDMDLLDKSNPTDISKAIRPVNINTIEWLIIDGVKYNVKA